MAHDYEALGRKVHDARRLMNLNLLAREFIMPDGPWIWIFWSESSLCPPVREFESLGQKVHYARRSMNLKLLVRKIITPDGSWIWSSWSESSLCPTVHGYEALGQKNHYARRSMNLKLKLFLYLMVHFTVQSSENLLCPKFHRSKVPSVASLVLRFIGVKLQWSEYLHIQVAMACLSWHDEMSISSFFITMRHVCIVCKFAKFILFIF